MTTGPTLWLSLASVLCALSVSAQLPPWRPAANPDPLRAASAPFDAGQAAEVPDGRWAVWLETSYANVWSGTWHTAAIQREFGRARLPLADDVLRTAEFRYPDEDFHRFDLEGWRADLWVTRGLPGGVSLSLRLPSFSYGSPHWDAIAEEWHARLGLPNANRDLFPRGDALLYMRGGGRTVLEERDVEASGFGDVALSASVPLGEWLGARHRAAAVVEAPTGEEGTVLGSGGWDAGVRWFALWPGKRVDLVAGAGYTWLGDGSLLGVARTDPWHLLGGLDWRVWRSLTATLRVTFERSLFAGTSDGWAGEPVLYERFGLAGPIGRGAWLAFELGQDSVYHGVAPDYSFHVMLGTSPLGALSGKR
ncbi:MAG: hypothetical protein ACOY3Y_04790 [Acidobacteriota bacterium]